MSSVSNLLYPGTSCIDVFSFLLGLNSLESKIYFHLIQNGKRTVSELQENISRNQSTTHVALQKLVALNVVRKEKRTKKPKGYEFVYTGLNPQEAKKILHERLLTLSTLIGKCIDTFDIESMECEVTFS